MELPALTTAEWVLAMLCGLLIGISKTGISGAGIAVVPIFALIFGGKPSTGLLLPMLIVADVFAVSYYNRHASWKHIIKLLPWAIAGIFIALFTGNRISSSTFKVIIGIVILISLIIIIIREKNKLKIIPTQKAVGAVSGLSGGFATMIGNAAGPILSIYLLSMRLPKSVFIGTGAWFFFIVNIFKVPLHIFVWNTITLNTLYFNLLMIPSIGAGIYAGIKFVSILPEKGFRYIVIVTTFISSLLLLL